MKRWIFGGIAAICVVIVAESVNVVLTYAHETRSASAQQKKQGYINAQIQHIKNTGGKGYAPPLAGSSLPSPLSNPVYSLISANHMPLPNATVVAPYNLSSEVYTDRVHWTIWTGNEVKNPTTGVLLAFDLRNNLALKSIAIPGAGLIQITGFKTITVDLKSNLGTGIYNTSTGVVTWN
ncbi:MAG: hypothetical protein ACYCYO_04800 [Bacilli bacterium]